MDTNNDTIWQEIDAQASALGVGDWARRKWRQRKAVPHKWRLPLIEKSDGRLSAEHFTAIEAAE